MAENNAYLNTDEKDGCDEDESNTVTLAEVLRAEEMLEENADAVLGPGDDKNCTHSEGYLKRQALYSCLTCMPVDGSERAGVCLACSYHCHGDHDLVELYTKRNFKCDCGNSLFKGKCCFLDPAKSGTNDENSYNQNFKGVYCSCHRPYPDPLDPVEDEMLQCIICEDWFHTRHLGTSVPKGDEYAEMICGPCMDKLPFLQYYLGHSISKVLDAEGKNESSTNTSVTETDDNDCTGSPLKKVSENDCLTEKGAKTQDGPLDKKDDTINEGTKENLSENKVSNDIEPKSDNEKIKGDTTTTPKKFVDSIEDNDKEKECRLKSLSLIQRDGNGATFWPDEFRKLLCKCVSCLELYSRHGVPFLVDEADTVQAYEEEGRQRRRQSGLPPGPTQYEQGMEALSSLDRVKQMEAILGYNDLKTNLMQYLSKFAENKKVVREEDIREFFSGMQARKRPKLDIPHNCR